MWEHQLHPTPQCCVFAALSSESPSPLYLPKLTHRFPFGASLQSHTPSAHGHLPLGSITAGITLLESVLISTSSLSP